MAARCWCATRRPSAHPRPTAWRCLTVPCRFGWVSWRSRCSCLKSPIVRGPSACTGACEARRSCDSSAFLHRQAWPRATEDPSPGDRRSARGRARRSRAWGPSNAKAGSNARSGRCRPTSRASICMRVSRSPPTWRAGSVDSKSLQAQAIVGERRAGAVAHNSPRRRATCDVMASRSHSTATSSRCFA